jgi:hypothetical protein
MTDTQQSLPVAIVVDKGADPDSLAAFVDVLCEPLASPRASAGVTTRPNDGPALKIIARATAADENMQLVKKLKVAKLALSEAEREVLRALKSATVSA